MTRSTAKSNNSTIEAEFRLVVGLLPRFCCLERPISSVFPISGRTLGVKRKQSPLGDQQIGQPQQREQLRRVLGQALVAHLPQAKPVLDDVEGVFDLGANARLDPLNLLVQSPHLGIRQGFALARPHRDMPGGIGTFLFPFLDALIPGIREDQALFAMQQGVALGHVVDVGGGGDDRVDQTRTGICADMHLHPEVPLVAFLGLVHFRIALATLVLGRGRRRDDRRVHHRALPEHQPLGSQVAVDAGEDAFSQLVGLQQTAELEQRRGIWRGFPRQVDAYKAPDRLTVVDGVFRAFVGQAKALLGDVHAQHPLQANRGATSAFALGIERLKLRHQCRPRRHRFDLAKKAISSRHLRLGRVLQVGKAPLHRLHPFNLQCPNSRKHAGTLAENISACP
jgi:hypothetical protein